MIIELAHFVIFFKFLKISEIVITGLGALHIFLILFLTSRKAEFCKHKKSKLEMQILVAALHNTLQLSIIL